MGSRGYLDVEAQFPATYVHQRSLMRTRGVAMLDAAYVVEIGTLVGLPVVDERLGGAVIECYDGTTEGDWAEVRVEGADFVQCPVVTQTEEHNFL